MTVPFNPLTLIPSAMDMVGGIVSANQARNAFKTRYQDTVADMKKAGLNPSLAYGQGGGNPSTVPLPNAGESMTKAIATSASAKQSQANAALTEAQTNLLRAQTAELSRRPGLENRALEFGFDKTQADTAYTRSQTDLSRANILNTEANTDNTRMRTIGENLDNQGRSTKNRILLIDEAIRGLDRDYAKATLEDRVALVSKALAQAGLNITSTEIANFLAEQEKPGAMLKAGLATDAQGARNYFREWSTEDAAKPDPGEYASDWWKNQVGEIRRWLTRHRLIEKPNY
ncbi:MAG: DNA pilot protein [Microvirus sp.]|nr:MAG: DNA pilot protein [Microvirus sp.]